ncbi:adenosine receptor A3-like [Protopterus annectens]|uniref:adenosine receptor A3-like n=1 Tax=Protopterus annectens TaxID=7888 RepID=UPI001CFB8B64|nr:adenosine receptor A3-like [Protopterus annectens]
MIFSPVEINDTSINCSTPSYLKLSDAVKISAMLLLIVAIILGNMLSLLVFLSCKQFHSPQGYLKTSLALADLSVGVLVVPYSAYTEINESFSSNCEQNSDSIAVHTINPCVLLGPIFAGCTFVSITTIFLLSIERGVAVLKPLHKKVVITKRRTLSMVITSWILSFIVAVTPTVANREITLKYSSCSKMCNYVLVSGGQPTADWNIMLLFPVLDFFLLCGTLALNLLTFSVIRQYNKTRLQLSEYDVQIASSRPSFADLAAAKTIAILTFAFLGSFGFITVFVVGSVIGYKWCEFSFYAFWILTSNSCWNVIIYSIRDPKFRMGVKETFFGKQVQCSPSYPQNVQNKNRPVETSDHCVIVKIYISAKKGNSFTVLHSNKLVASNATYNTNEGR